MKKFLAWMVVAVVSVAMSSTEASADPKKPKPSREQIFKRLDKDGDGKLTYEEFKAKKKEEAAQKMFKRLDANADQSLSLEEFTAVRKKKKNQ